MASHILNSYMAAAWCSGLVSKDCSLADSPHAPSPSHTGAGRMDVLSHSVPHPSPSRCGVLGRKHMQTFSQPCLSCFLPWTPTLPP